MVTPYNCPEAYSKKRARRPFRRQQSIGTPLATKGSKFGKEVVMLNTALRTFFIGLVSTAMAVCATAMATSASPAFASAPFTPVTGVSVL
jgi:hypothetical protein